MYNSLPYVVQSQGEWTRHKEFKARYPQGGQHSTGVDQLHSWYLNTDESSIEFKIPQPKKKRDSKSSSGHSSSDFKENYTKASPTGPTACSHLPGPSPEPMERYYYPQSQNQPLFHEPTDDYFIAETLPHDMNHEPELELQSIHDTPVLPAQSPSTPE